MLKKSKTAIAALAVMVAGTQMTLTHTSHAAVTVAAIGFGIAEKFYGYQGSVALDKKWKAPLFGAVATCWLGGYFYIPIVGACLLGEEGTTDLNLASEYFSENGYTPVEETEIRAEHARFLEASKAKNALILLNENVNKDSLNADINAILPDVSPAYVDFVSASLGIK